ncbi:MAG: DNA-binding protein [Thaumarchaeota archaeon]|nr:DNA-binding protein [Nitrososphaerota archaeon]
MSYPNPDEFDNQTNQTKDAQAEEQKEQVLRQILEPVARSRLGNVKMVKPELASLVENYLIGMATQGKINGQLSDDQLKQILLSIQQPKRDFKINRR